jgi:hypothetical protein
MAPVASAPGLFVFLGHGNRGRESRGAIIFTKAQVGSADPKAHGRRPEGRARHLTRAGVAVAAGLVG